jgi:CubicO group peptidase (beta-lactamase class C family)
MSTGFDEARIARLRDVMAGHVESYSVPGLAWLLARHGEVLVGATGTMEAGGGAAVQRDTIFRLSSMTKPITAVAALTLVEECKLRLDEPVDELLPELAGRRVMAEAAGSLDNTVPAARPITLRDLLTFTLGVGYDFAATGPQVVLAAMDELGLSVGPPQPARSPEPDEWMRRFGTLPLAYQPGARWLYDTGTEVLGVLIARASGQALEAYMRERIFEPLGMRDTGFFVPASKLDRFGACYQAENPATGTMRVYDPVQGQWSQPPAFPSGSAGLVSTVEDYFAFAEMLRGGGAFQGKRILSRPSMEAMTADQLTPEQKVVSSLDPTGAVSWGFGVGVQVRRTGPARSVGTYGWDGGLGSSWANDPREDLVGILLTNQAWPSPVPPPVFQDFWTCAYAAIPD